MCHAQNPINITFPIMKQRKIRIQLEFHQELPKCIVASLLILPLRICCVTSLEAGRQNYLKFPLGQRRYPSYGQYILRTL